MQQLPVIAFDNSYARDLEGFYVPWTGSRPLRRKSCG